MKTKKSLVLILAFSTFLICVFALACTGKKQPTLDGHWRALWTSSGGEIPADLYIKTNEEGELEAEVHNDTEIVKFSRVQKTGDHIDFFIDRFECQISAVLSEDGESMSGEWSKQVGTPNQMPFLAVKGDLERFPKDKYHPPINEALMKDIAGTWRLRFEGDTYDSVGLFRQEGERVTGTIRAIDGDFRWLEGVYRNGLLLLSSFNGTWVFLFKAEIDDQGILHGYWARGTKKPINWTAIKEEPSYPDTFKLTELANQQGLLSFKYPTAENPQEFVSDSDPQFKDKPLLAAFYLTGCPNCHDSAALLSQIYKEYHSRGLNMVFIYYELTKDVEKIQARVRRFQKEHDLPSPALFSLAMSKKEIVEEIPDFKSFLAWPTVVFYRSDGKVDCIHTGIDGPATGEYHTKLVKEYRNRIEKLLSSVRE